MIIYQTDAKSTCPVKALVSLEGGMCSGSLCGLWDWYAAQVEVKAFIEQITKSNWSALQIDFSKLVPPYTFGSVMQAHLIILKRLASARQATTTSTLRFIFDSPVKTGFINLRGISGGLSEAMVLKEAEGLRPHLQYIHPEADNRSQPKPSIPLPNVIAL